MGNQKITVDVDINGHIKGFEQAVSKANQALKGLRIDDKSTQHAKDMFKTLQVELGKYQQLSQDALSGKNVASALNTSKNRIISTLRTIGKEYESLGRGDIGLSEEIRKLQDELTTLKSGFSDIGSSIANQFGNNITTSVTALNGKMKAGVGYVEDFMTALKSGNPDEVADKFEKLEKYQSRFGEKSKDFTAIFQTCKTANEAFGTSIESTNIEMANLEQRISALSDQDLAALQSIVEKLGLDFDEFSNYIREATEENTKLSASTRESQKEFDNLSSRIKQFFSLTNGFILFRRAVQGAFNTVKELDAVMTETAVVTDFSVSDMWDKLPEYTKMANELGATTKGAYETATLYYQQGLKTNEVMAVSAETMKMARIAGLDYATATDYMTAALRGFNMEINTDSAQRVNDVYSRLAAITASNTQEISVAMTKVASLAHNANMEFETTAAFLAQIIETTRESAETAGTALKTVVARFTEVKKLYNEGELMGTDEEGEEIDVNKVATALRSAGIDMNKYFTGLVGLDDIFMELASKWDSLDKVQQRYIATMAAGSRQQSRFIAMMSNYQRTLELVGEAENSAGAGQKQFEKTMESLEAKLNRLKNAWDSFLMGLANSDIIKSAVDWLTNLITKINDLLTAMSGGSGVAKTFATLFTGLAGGAIAKGGLDLLTGGLFALMGRNKENRQVKSSFFNDLFKGPSNNKSIEDQLDNILGRKKDPEYGAIAERVVGLATNFGTLKERIGTVTDAINNFSLKGFDGLKGMGEALGALKTGFTGLMGSIGQLIVAIGPYVLAIGAAIAAFIALKKAIYEATHQAEILTEKGQALKDSAAQTREEIQNLQNTVDGLKDKQEYVDDLIVGTKEWKEAVVDLNAEYQKLMEQDENAKAFMTFDNKGNYVFDYEGYQKFLGSLSAGANSQETLGYSYDISSAKVALNDVLSGIEIGGYGVGGWRELTNEQKRDLYEKIQSNEVNAYNYEQYLKDNYGFNTVETKFEDVAASAVDVNTALFNLAQALNEYAKRFGLPTLTEEEYDQETRKRAQEYSSLDQDSLLALAKERGLNTRELYEQATNNFNGEGTYQQVTEEYFRLIAESLAKTDAFDFGNLNPGLANAYTSNQVGMDDLQKQQYGINLNAMKEAGIQLTSDLLAQAAEYTKNGEDIQKLIDSLIKLMEVENSHAENVEALRETNKNANLGLSEEQIEAQTIAWEKDEKEIKKLQDTLSNTPDDYEAIQKAAEEAFDSKVTEDFIKENIDDLLKLAAGGEDAAKAFDDLAQKLAVDNVNNALIEMGKNALNLGSIIDQINGMEISVGGSADITPIYDALVQMLEDAGVATEEATKIAEGFLTSLNYELTWVDDGYDYITVPEIKAGVKGDKYTVTESTGKEGGSVRIPMQRKRLVASKTGTNPYTPKGLGGSGGTGGSGGGGGGSDSNPDRWLNPYDKFYNLTEQINEALRQREKLERNYDRILKNRLSKQRDIQANTQARLNSLKQEIAMNRALLAGRQSQVDAVLNEKFLDDNKNIRTFREFGVGRYANYNTERGTIEIDWEGLERLSGTTDTQLGGIIENYVSRLEELQKQFEDVDKTIEDLEDEVAEILDINKEEYLSFEQRVFEAIVDRQQKLIDNYSELSDTISNNDEEVLNALSESIDLSRQIRDNTKTEEEIAQKEARLAYLRRDTSGANDLAIKQLEKELEEARQSYGDTLVDQELDRLSQASEEAAKQRERQIEIMEAQLEWQQRVGFFWPEVIDLLQNNYGELDEGISDALMNLLKNTDAFSGMSEYQQANWAQELHEQWLQSESGLASWRLSEAKAASMGKEGNESNYSIAADQTTAGKALRYDYNRDIWMDEDEGWYTGVSYDSTSNQFTYEGYSSKASRDEEEAKKTAAAQAAQAKRNITVGSYINASGAPIYTSAYGGSPLHQYFAEDPKYLVLDDYGSSWMVRWHGLSSGITGFFRKGDVRAYKTGGLVDYTGPAWLDGTPQRPEFVLNADQTQAFMKLVDKLGSGAGAGDNYFDINIVVDELSSDYDVDKMVDRIKQKITEDAQYRNVNAINWIR